LSGQENTRFKGGLPDYLIRHTTFRQMQIFEAVVRLGSFTRAAEELFLTQPTVSTQLKKLTDVMELPLVDQSGRKLKPTEAGESLYLAIRQIFDCMADLDTRMADLKGVRRGRLRLCVITTAKYFAPEILGEFSREYPDIDISLKVTNRDRVLERLLNNDDDLYIMGQPPEDADNIKVYPFAENPLVVMSGRDHPLTKESNIPLERLAQEPLISREVGSGIRDSMMKLFDKHQLKPNIRMEIGSNEGIKHGVVGGLGLAILSLHTLELEGAEGPVDVLDVEGFPIKRQLYLAHSDDKALSPITQAFLEFALIREPMINTRMQALYETFSKRHKAQRTKNQRCETVR